MLIIQKGTLVSPAGTYKADIAIESGVIHSISRSITPGPQDERVDAEGLLVFPGFIDAHTHLSMDNGQIITADTFETGTQAAICGGTTTLIDFATQDKGETLQKALEKWHGLADTHAFCDFAFHMAITDWNEETRQALAGMVEQGITSFKIYLAYDALRVDDGQVLDILREMKNLKGLMGVHCENGTLINHEVARLRREGHLSPIAHALSRPAEMEAEAIARLLYIARIAEWPVAVVHLSSQLGLNEVRKARQMGQKVLVETCPQYLFLDDSLLALPDFEGAKYVCSPPLRKESDIRALREALAGGEIDTLATDHCSYNFKGQKELGKDDFSQIPNGLPGIEHRPALIYGLVQAGIISLEQMGQLLSTAPAKAYGLYPQKGALQPGSDADIVLWETGDFGTISAKTQHQNVDYTPYEGFQAAGRAKAVYLRGELVVQDGEPCGLRQGKYIPRTLPML